MAHGIFVGLSTIDVVYHVDGFPTANSKVVAQSQDVFVGGPATNAAIAFAHLGGSPSLVTAAGRNALAARASADEHFAFFLQLFAAGLHALAGQSPVD